MNKKTVVIIVALVVILILAGLAFWYFSKQSGQTQTSTGTSTSSGSGGLLNGLGGFGNIGAWWGNLFGGGSTNSTEVGCDPSACDPDRTGYNMCGDQWFPCG